MTATIDYSNLDLKSKTFLDFTDNPEVIDEVLGSHDDMSRNLFFENLDDMLRARTFLYYSELVRDAQFTAKVNEVFESEIATFFDE